MANISIGVSMVNLRSVLLVLVLAGFCFAGLSVPNWTLSAESFKPGSSGVVTIELSNPLVTDSDVKILSSVDMAITPPPGISMVGKQFVGDIEPGGSTKVSLPFKVAQNITSSIYSVEIKITGISDNPSGLGGFNSFSRRLIIPISVVNEPILTLGTDKQLIGGIDSVILTITNNGGKATNLRITIPNSSSVALYGINEKFLPIASGTSAVNITLDSRGSDDGPTDIPFNISYENELGVSKSQSSNLRMTIRNQKLDLKFIQQSSILSKKESSLTLEIKNSGSETLKDLRLSFQNSSTRFKDVSELKFGDLGPGQSMSASAVLFSDLPPGVNLVDSKITWIEKDVQKEESVKVPLTITSDADVGIYLEAKPLPLTLGSEHTISVLVSNLGSYRIDNVDVSISSPALRSLDISNVQYIGGLQNDDFSTVQFVTNVNATTGGTYPIEITIHYRDQSGEWRTKVVEQNITIYPAAKGDDNLPLVIGLVMVAVGVWYFKFRKPVSLKLTGK